jgi:hypothetical protein
MAVYKVPQDVEAEDKFFGPFSFKQFLFIGGAAVCAYLTFIFLTKGIWPLAAVFALPMIIFGFLAFPWSKDQPTELWLAAHIRFLFVRRRRIWDQSGMKELVTITAPKREVHALTDGLSQDEVRNRFNALATVVDSRGWAVKNLVSNSAVAQKDSDRLAEATLPSTEQEEQIVQSTKDVLDEKSNPLAHQFDTMIEESKEKHHKEAIAKIEEARRESAEATKTTPNKQKTQEKAPSLKAHDLDFMNQGQHTPKDPSLASFKNTAVVEPGQKAAAANPVMGMGQPVGSIKEQDEQALLEKVHKQQAQEEAMKKHSHLKTIQPMSAQAQNDDDDQSQTPAPQEPIQNTQASTGAAPVDPAILSLSDNDDLNVETLARQAKKDLPDDDEVVISLH